MAVPPGPNQCWSLDFVSDALVSSRRFRVLAVIDQFSRACQALAADTSLGGTRVARELDVIIAQRDKPAMVVSDDGAELTSNAILRWTQDRGIA